MGTPSYAALTPALYDQFSALVLERTGLLYGADKRQDLAKKLSATMVFCGCNSLLEYYAHLCKQPATSADWERCIRELTVGETYFMRNKGHIAALRDHILPDLIKQREHTRFLRIWSAGCSTGEEPYSVAILLHDLLPNVRDWNITILATDLNRESLQVAQRARYRSWSFRGVDPGTVSRHFQEQDGWFELNRDIRSMVRFGYLNLVDDDYPSLSNNTYGLDLILCRNVTIYFSFDVTRRVVGRFYTALTEGGWLIPGSSEPNLMTYQEYTPRNFPGAVVYRKQVKASNVQSAPKPMTQSGIPETAPTVSPSPPSRKPPAPREAKPVPRYEHKATAHNKRADQMIAMHYRDALALWKSGRVKDAVALLESNVQRNPRHVKSYHALARIYADRGDLAKAKDCCERAIARDRRQYEPYFVLSMIYQNQGKDKDAIEMLRKVVLFNPNLALGHYALHTLLASQGQQKQALDALSQARRLLIAMPRDALLEEGDGMRAGNLLDIVERMLETA